jgi:hypothetical protein
LEEGKAALMDWLAVLSIISAGVAVVILVVIAYRQRYY